MRDYSSETARLQARYDRAIGDALELGIKTFIPGSGRPAHVTPTGKLIPADFGPWMKSLGELEDEIRAARGDSTPAFENVLLEAYLKADR